MHILLSNDDGYRAPGIGILRKRLLDEGHRVTLFAPDRNRSACSSSLTVRRSLQPIEVEEDVWYLPDGTPADCVHLALGGLFDFQPDAILSGINDGANLGDDILYSGTVAAAIEGRHCDCPKIAISITDGDDFECASEVAVVLIKRLFKQNRRHDLLNVNIPNLPFHQLKGYRLTRLGNRVKSHPISIELDQAGEPKYYIGEVGESSALKSGTDFEAIEQGFVSVTPLTVDMTDHLRIDSLSAWLEQ